MPYPASVISFVLAEKAVRENYPVTQMKLQRMVYFAHGYHLAKYKKPLVNEVFQAWKFGPVLPSMYRTYVLYGPNPIFDTRKVEAGEKLLDLSQLDAKAQDAINTTWKFTHRLPASQLSAWAKKPDSPWAKTYLFDTESMPMDNQVISEYFSKMLKAS